MAIKIDISFGELIDKLTILEIKSERITDPAKLTNVRRELKTLRDIWDNAAESKTDISQEMNQLKSINEKLWEIEDAIRIKEKTETFDQEFIELARSVYFVNDDRASIKRQINKKLNSDLIEEKSYADYRKK